MGLCISKAAIKVATGENADGGFCSRTALKFVSDKDQPKLEKKLDERAQAQAANIHTLSARLGISIPDGMYQTNSDRN